jgi:prophage regulatory protein
MTPPSPFLFVPEVDDITRLSDTTRWRMEKRGLFPRRVSISPGRVAWRRSDIDAWLSDPEGWGKRPEQQAAG